MSQVAINHFDTQFGSKYTPPISHLDLKALLLSFWGVINILATYLLLTTCFISFLSFSLIPPLFLYPLSFPPLPSLSLSLFSSLSPLICFPKRFISAAQPSNLNWYDDTAVDSMYVCKFLLLSHLISLSLSLSSFSVSAPFTSCLFSLV